MASGQSGVMVCASSWLSSRTSRWISSPRVVAAGVNQSGRPTMPGPAANLDQLLEINDHNCSLLTTADDLIAAAGARAASAQFGRTLEHGGVDAALQVDVVLGLRQADDPFPFAHRTSFEHCRTPWMKGA